MCHSGVPQLCKLSRFLSSCVIMFHVLGNLNIYFLSKGKPVWFNTNLNQSVVCQSGIIHLELAIKGEYVTADSLLVAANKGIDKFRNFTQICDYQLPVKTCHPKNTPHCYCSYINASITVLTARFKATPDLSKAGFQAFFTSNGTLSAPLDIFYLHQIFGRESVNLTINGQLVELDYCNVTMLVDSRLTIRFCAFNLSRPRLYCLYNGESLYSRGPSPPSPCLVDDIILTDQSRYIELSFIDECQRTAAYYCELNPISKSSKSYEDITIAEITFFTLLTIAVGIVLFVGLFYILQLVTADFRDSLSTNASTPPQAIPENPVFYIHS